MPTKEQLERALIGADKAGDVEAAKALATALKAGQYDDQVPQAATVAAPPRQDSFAKNTLDVLGELSASANRSVTGMLDFVGPDTVNSMLTLAGSERRVPTLTGLLEPTGIRGGMMEPGPARDAVRAGGALIPVAAGMVPVQGRNLATSAKDVVAEFLGAGTQAVTSPIKSVASTVSDTVQGALPNKARDAAKLPLLRQSGDVAAAGFKLDGDRVVKDAIQQKALKAGLDEGAVAMIASANKATKSRIKDMVSVLEGGRKNLEFRNFNTPQKVVGEAITDRLKVIQGANRQAASQLDNVANSLKGKPVDVSGPINKFIGDMEAEGIVFNPQTGGLDFSNSSIQDLTDVQNIVNRVFRRLYNTADPTQNAYNVHRAKKFIDEQVSYGKTQAGLSGRMENIVKGLRRNLDQTLDSAFPEYNRVNTVYSETRGVIDDLQGLAGTKVDLNGDNVSKALGTMSRKVLSNYNTGTATEDLFKSLDDVSRKYGSPLTSRIDDDLFKLVSAEAEIRKMFPSAVKPNTFQGEIGTEVGRAAVDAATGNKIGLLSRAAKAAGKIFSPDDEAKIKALKDLLD